jgi:hypothetical protein
MTGSDRASAKSTAAPASIYWPGQQQRSCTSGAWAGRARLDSRADTGFYADPRNRHRTTHVYPLADLAYSMCFSEHHSQLFAHVRLNVFSDLGGAACL